jgi:hypothetical protein
LGLLFSATTPGLPAATISKVPVKRPVVPGEQLALSPQCGFGGLDSISIPEEDQWRKFERILETSRLMWG